MRLHPALLPIAVLTTACHSPGLAESRPPGTLLHHVYFDLVDGANHEEFADLLEESLEHCAPILELEVGTRARESARDVNDTDYDVLLVVTFPDFAAHDEYQVSPEHDRLLELGLPLIERVRVFDAWSR